MLINQKKKNYHQLDFFVHVDNNVKMKESQKINLDITSELKKSWNMNVTVIPIVVRVTGKAPKTWKKKLVEP